MIDGVLSGLVLGFDTLANLFEPCWTLFWCKFDFSTLEPSRTSILYYFVISFLFHFPWLDLITIWSQSTHARLCATEEWLRQRSMCHDQVRRKAWTTESTSCGLVTTSQSVEKKHIVYVYYVPLPTKTDKNNRFKKNTMFWMQTRCFHFLCFFESVIFCSFLTWTFAAVFNSTLVVLTPPKVTLGLNQRVNCQDLYSKFQDVLFNACVLFILRYSPAGTH